MALVLVIEDEEDLAITLEFNLEREGHTVRLASTAAKGLQEARREPVPDVILLDLMLPDSPGTEVCRQLRLEPATRDVSIIMLTARTEEIDRVVGFEVGADDYVSKPFSVRELMLRVRAVMRRSKGSKLEDEAGSQIVVGRLRVDPTAHQVWLDEQELALTALEFRLLRVLLERKGRVQTRDRLLSDVWGIDADVTTRTVDTHVKRLRHKLGAAAEYIETLRGVGYRCRARVDGEL